MFNLQARKTGKRSDAQLKRAGAAPGKHSAIARIKGLARNLKYSMLVQMSGTTLLCEHARY